MSCATSGARSCRASWSRRPAPPRRSTAISATHVPLPLPRDLAHPFDSWVIDQRKLSTGFAPTDGLSFSPPPKTWISARWVPSNALPMRDATVRVLAKHLGTAAAGSAVTLVVRPDDNSAPASVTVGPSTLRIAGATHAGLQAQLLTDASPRRGLPRHRAAGHRRRPACRLGAARECRRQRHRPRRLARHGGIAGARHRDVRPQHGPGPAAEQDDPARLHQPGDRAELRARWSLEPIDTTEPSRRCVIRDAAPVDLEEPMTMLSTHPPRAVRGRRLLALGLALALACVGLGLTAGSAAAAPGDTIVSIQFDDGISDQYQAGALLASHGMHGTFFINSGEVGSSGFYMTWSQIHDLASAGNEIGGHTLHHPDLATISTAQAHAGDLRRPHRARESGFHGHELRVPLRLHQQLRSRRSSRAAATPPAAASRASSRRAAARSAPSRRRCRRRIPSSRARPENAAEHDDAGRPPGLRHAGRAARRRLGAGGLPPHLHIGCTDTYSTTPTTLNDFLTWLQPRAASNHTFVRTTREALQTTSSDTTPPTVALTAPADGATVSGTVQLTASASDTVGVQRVEFYQGSTLIGTAGVRSVLPQLGHEHGRERHPRAHGEGL